MPLSLKQYSFKSFKYMAYGVTLSQNVLQMHLPSVELTWASVMRNQQRVCSFRKEHAMAPGFLGLWQI